MDIIKIKIEEEAEADRSYNGDGKLASYIPVLYHDGTQHYELVISCSINEVEIKKAFDAHSFLRSGKTGSHEIFTCSCGIAGCAGIWDGVNVKSRRHTVEWRIPAGSNYYPLSKRFYSFDKRQYEQERQELYDKLVEYSKTLNVHDQFSHGCHDGSLMKNVIKYYTKAYNGKYWYENS